MVDIEKKPQSDPRESLGRSQVLNWVIITAIVALVLSIVLPLALQLGMKMEFRATSESTSQWEEIEGEVLAGAETEHFIKTVATEYKSDFVPGQLGEMKAHFIGIMVFYGPMLITGSPLEITGVPAAGSEGLRSAGSISLRSIWPSVVFFLIFILLLLGIDVFVKDQFAVLKFVIAMSLFWLGYALVMWFIGRWVLVPLGNTFNGMLTEEQGSANYVLGIVNIFSAAIKIFLVGSIYWVGSFLLKKARTEPDTSGFGEHAKALRT